MGAMSELDAAVADLKAAARALDTAADSLVKLFSGGDRETGERRPLPAAAVATFPNPGEGKDGEGSVVSGQGPGPETSSGADAPPSDRELDPGLIPAPRAAWVLSTGEGFENEGKGCV